MNIKIIVDDQEIMNLDVHAFTDKKIGIVTAISLCFAVLSFFS